MKLTWKERASQRSAAREYVLDDLRRAVAERKRIAEMWERGTSHDVYRREILRLWRKALRAVES